MDNRKDKLKAMVLDLVRNYGVISIDVSSEPLISDPASKTSSTHESSSECTWAEEDIPGGGTKWVCKQAPGESCDKGICKSVTIRTTVNGVTKTVSLCECSVV